MKKKYVKLQITPFGLDIVSIRCYDFDLISQWTKGLRKIINLEFVWIHSMFNTSFLLLKIKIKKSIQTCFSFKFVSKRYSDFREYLIDSPKRSFFYLITF